MPPRPCCCTLWGDDDAAWKKLSALLANTKVLNRSTLVFDGNGSGEYPLGISLEYAGYLWAHNGAPVKVIYPTDGTTALAEGAAVIKGAPDPDAAHALVDYLAEQGDAGDAAPRHVPASGAAGYRPRRDAPAACRRSRRSSFCPMTMRNGMRRSARRRPKLKTTIQNTR